MILNAEYEYAIQTCLQAHEDRARVASYYLVGVGSLIVAILGAQVETLQNAPFYGAFATLFLLLSAYGVVTLLQLVRLREAWIDSAAALCQIKEYYIERCQEVDLAAAFRWRAATRPQKYRPWSVSFLLAVQVALLGGATLGAAVVCAGLAFGWGLYAAGIVVGFLAATANVALYRHLLRERNPSPAERSARPPVIA